MVPKWNMATRKRMLRAIIVSAAIIVLRLFHRSTYDPAKGAIKTCGNNAIIVAMASTVAEPV